MSEIVRLLCGSCPSTDRRVLARIVTTDDGLILRARSRRPDVPRWSGVPVRAISEDVTVRVADLGDPYRHSDGIVVGCGRHGWGALKPEFIRSLVEESERTRRRIVRVLDFD